MAGDRCYENYEIGEQHHSRARTTTDADIRMIIGAAACDHPNHTDAVFTADHPIFRAPCTPGVLVLSMADGFFIDAMSMNMRLPLSYGYDRVRFLKPVYPGDTLRADLEVVAKRVKNNDWGIVDVQLEVLNQDDVLVAVLVHKLLVLREGSSIEAPNYQPEATA